MFTLVISVQAAHATDTSLTDARSRLDQRFNRAVQQLVRESESDEERNLREQALLPQDPSRHYLYLPSSIRASTTDDDKLARLDRIFGDELFELATRSLEAGHAAQAYQWLHEVLQHNPDHEIASRAVGAPSDFSSRVRRGKRPHAKYGWKAGSYLQVDTPNYRITTNGNERSALQLAETLEQLNAAWRQLFFNYWSSTAALNAAMKGRPLIQRRKTKHQVVLFSDRERYVEFLQQVEPKAQMTLGYYQASSRTAFFFGDASNRSTWLHEATHQLFQESKRTRLGVGESDHFWIVEGVALYMESLKDCKGYVSAGGVESDRLQFARYRLMRENYYVPIHRFVEFGRIDLQGDPSIRKLYSQAAGLTHFFMNADRGKHRSALVDYIISVYAQTADEDSLPTLVGKSYANIDSEYRDFLDVDDTALAQLEPAVVVRNLALGSTQISDTGMLTLDQLDDLVWLDLKGTNVTDAGTVHLSNATALTQLSFEETSVGDNTVNRLATARRLEELDLSHTQISDVSLKTIAQFPNLKVLWLTGTKVTDDGIRLLHGLSNLRQVDVTGTSVTAEGWRQLRESLPNFETE